MPEYYAFIQSHHTRECAPLRRHRGKLAPVLERQLRKWAEKHDAEPNPRYFIDVRELPTAEPIFRGQLRGPLAPVLAGEMMERALIIDAGKRLNAEQRKEACHAGR